MGRKIIIGIIGLLLFLTPGTIGFGLFYFKFLKPIPVQTFEAPANQQDARLQDLNYLHSFTKYDNSFSDKERQQFSTFIDDMAKTAGSMSDAEFSMSVARAVAISENGHTNVGRRSMVRKANSLPVRFFWFSDGLYILRTHTEHEGLLGAQVISYDGRDPSDLVKALDPYYGSNEAFHRYNSGQLFSSPALMHAVGLAANSDRVTLEVKLLSGETQTVDLAIAQNPTLLSRSHAIIDRKVLDVERESGVNWVYLTREKNKYGALDANPDKRYWTGELPGGGALVRLRFTWASPDQPLKPWLKSVSEKLSASPARYLVLDLRSNPGGDYTIPMSFAKNIKDLVQPGGKIYILTDNGTFSAAIVTAALTLHGGGEDAVLVGETMGDFGQFWAESGRVMTLPNSDIRISASTGYHDWENGCTDWSTCYWINILFGVAAGSLDVDVPAPLEFSDLLNGDDPAIDAVLDAEGITE